MKPHINLLENLIRNAAVSSDAGKVNRSAEMVADYLRTAGIPHLTFEECGEHRILFAANRPGKVQEVIINAHLDVVPAEPGQFEPIIDGDRLIGRGAVDDLGNAVAAIEALRLLKDAPIGIGIIFTADEEVGGSTTEYMVSQGYAATKLAVVLDGNANAIVNREKGIAVFKCVATGKACHASEPWEGDNPISKLARGLCHTENAFATWPQAHPNDPWHLTMAPCIINAGNADNQVPGEASLHINVRYTDVQELTKFEALLRENMGSDDEITIEHSRTCAPVFCNEQDPIMQMLMEELKAALPDREPKFETMCGATDARHITGWNVPIAITGLEGGGFHSANEWVSLTSLDRYTAWLCAVIKRLENN